MRLRIRLLVAAATAALVAGAAVTPAAAADPAPGPAWTAARVLAGLKVGWSSPQFASGLHQPVVTTAGVVIGDSSLNSHVLTGADVGTGAVRWTRAAPPTSSQWGDSWGLWGAADGLVYATTIGYDAAPDVNELYALNAATGATVWTVPIPDQVGRSQFDDVQVADGHVLLSAQQPAELRSYDPATGRLLWTAAGVGGAEQVDAGGGRLFAGSDLADLVALDPATGAVRWRTAVPGGLPEGARLLALSSGRVAVETGRLDDDGNTVDWVARVYDGDTGAQVWTAPEVGQDVGERQSGWSSSAGTLYVATAVASNQPATAGHLWALDEATGQVRWSTPAPSAEGDPTVLPDAVLAGCWISDGNVFPAPMGALGTVCGFRRSDGQPLGYTVVASEPEGAPVVVGDLALMPTIAGLQSVAPAPLLPVPGKIEAEASEAPTLTTTAQDTGGGLLAGYFPAGGTVLDYPVNVDHAGAYRATFRLASDAANLSPPISPRLELQVVGVGSLATVTVPQTGGWQTWQSVTTTVTLPAGPQRLRIYVPAGAHAFNINWFDLEPATAAAARTARALPRTTAAERRQRCLAGLRPSTAMNAVRIAAACAAA